MECCHYYSIFNSYRPDLAIVISKLAFTNRPGKIHWQQLMHCLRYLKGTMNGGIVLKETNVGNIEMFTDADWGGSKDRRSTTGYLLTLGNNIIIWKSVLQKNIAHSTEEAEFKAFASGISEL